MWELARAAREKLGGDAMVDVLAAQRAYLERIRTRARAVTSRWSASGGGQDDADERARTEDRASECDVDAVVEHEVGDDIPSYFREHGEAAFRAVEEQWTVRHLETGERAAGAGGGARRPRRCAGRCERTRS